MMSAPGSAGTANPIPSAPPSYCGLHAEGKAIAFAGIVVRATTTGTIYWMPVEDNPGVELLTEMRR
jgi:hypothetical protein